MNRLFSRVLATLLGVGIGSGTFVWLVPNPELAGTMALSWAVAIGLAFRHDDLMFWRFETPGRGTSL